MITEIPFSIISSNAKVSPHFLISTKDGYEYNKDPNQVKILCTIAANVGHKERRRRFESSIMTQEEATPELVKEFEKIWKERYIATIKKEIKEIYGSQKDKDN